MKRRVIWLAVCLMMIVSVFTSPMSALAASGKYMKTNVGVHLRDPNDYTHIVGKVKKNKTVWFTGKTKQSFYLVRTESGKEGYVFKMYLNDIGAVNKGKVYVTNTTTKLYKSPSTKAKGRKLEEGKYVQVFATKGGWAYGRNSKGKTGYVPTSALSKAKN